MTIEKRVSPRYSVALPIDVGNVAGTTVNISTGGVVFHSPHGFEAGSTVDFRIQMGGGSKTPVTMTCRGVVLRTRTLPNGMHETALTIDTLRTTNASEISSRIAFSV